MVVGIITQKLYQAIFQLLPQFVGLTAGMVDFVGLVVEAVEACSFSGLMLQLLMQR